MASSRNAAVHPIGKNRQAGITVLREGDAAGVSMERRQQRIAILGYHALPLERIAAGIEHVSQLALMRAQVTLAGLDRQVKREQTAAGLQKVAGPFRLRSSFRFRRDRVELRPIASGAAPGHGVVGDGSGEASVIRNGARNDAGSGAARASRPRHGTARAGLGLRREFLRLGHPVGGPLAVHHPSRSHSRAEFWRGGRKRAGGGRGSPALDDLRERFGHKFMFVDAHEKAATEPQKQNIPGPTVRLNE